MDIQNEILKYNARDIGVDLSIISFTSGIEILIKINYTRYQNWSKSFVYGKVFGEGIIFAELKNNRISKLRVDNIDYTKGIQSVTSLSKIKYFTIKYDTEYYQYSEAIEEILEFINGKKDVIENHKYCRRCKSNIIFMNGEICEYCQEQGDDGR